VGRVGLLLHRTTSLGTIEWSQQSHRESISVVLKGFYVSSSAGGTQGGREERGGEAYSIKDCLLFADGAGVGGKSSRYFSDVIFLKFLEPN
jgi:hypothetical protein